MAVPQFRGADRILGAVQQLAAHNAQERAIEEQKRREREQRRANQYGVMGGALGAIGAAALVGATGGGAAAVLPAMGAGYGLGSMVGQTAAGSAPPPEQAIPTVINAGSTLGAIYGQQQQQQQRDTLAGAIAGPEPVPPMIAAPGTQNMTQEQYTEALRRQQVTQGLASMGAIEPALKMSGLMGAAGKTTVVGPGGVLVDEAGQPIYKNPRTETGSTADPLVTFQETGGTRSAIPRSQAEQRQQAKEGTILGPAASAPVIPGATADARGMAPQVIVNPDFGKTPGAPQYVFGQVAPDGSITPTKIEAPAPAGAGSGVSYKERTITVAPELDYSTGTPLPLREQKQASIDGGRTWSNVGAAVELDKPKPPTVGSIRQYDKDANTITEEWDGARWTQKATAPRSVPQAIPLGQTRTYEKDGNKITEQWNGAAYETLGTSPEHREAKILTADKVEGGQPGYIYKQTPSGDIEVLHKPPSADVLSKRDSAQIASQLRGEYTRQTNDFAERQGAYGRVLEAHKRASDPTNAAPGVADIGLIFGLMKMEDPESTVREGEAATVQNSGGVPAWLRNQYNALLQGSKLDQTVRDEILGRSKDVFTFSKIQYAQTQDTYRALAGAYSIDPNLVVTPRAKGEEWKPPGVATGAVGAPPAAGAVGAPPTPTGLGTPPAGALTWTKAEVERMPVTDLRSIDWANQTLSLEVLQAIRDRLAGGE